MNQEVRFALSDRHWGGLKKLTAIATLIGPRRRGRKSRNERLRIEAILWIVRAGVSWRDLPAVFGLWKKAPRRWTKSGLWETVLMALSATERDDAHLMIDSTSSRIHQHASGAAGGQLAQGMGTQRPASRRKSTWRGARLRSMQACVVRAPEKRRPCHHGQGL